MSYIDTKHPAPFGAITIYRATNALTDAVEMLRFRRRPTALVEFSPAQLEDLGLSVADVEPRRPGFIAGMVAAFGEWNARRRTIAELGRLSDAQLDDIGLTRGDVYELRFGNR